MAYPGEFWLRIYRQPTSNWSEEAIKLPSKTTSFKQWSEQLREYASVVQQELDYWLAEPRKHVSHLPVDYPGELTQWLQPASCLTLSVAETKVLLQEVPAAYHTQINDVLLTALVQHLHSGQRALTAR